jgi:hypothetical protein
MASSSHHRGASNEQWASSHSEVTAMHPSVRPDAPSTLGTARKDHPRRRRGQPNARIAALLGICEDTAGKWRHYWCTAPGWRR